MSVETRVMNGQLPIGDVLRACHCYPSLPPLSQSPSKHHLTLSTVYSLTAVSHFKLIFPRRRNEIIAVVQEKSNFRIGAANFLERSALVRVC